MKKLTFTLISLLFCVICFAQKALEQDLIRFSNNTGATITKDETFGTANFVKFSPNKRLYLQGNTAKDKAVNFLGQYKSIFGLKSADNTLRYELTKTDNYGLKNVIFKQEYEGVPVFDGELRFHFDRDEKLSSVNGNIMPNIELNAIARLSSTEADNLALNQIYNQNLNNSGEQLFVFSNTLYVFPKGLVEGYVSSYHLVYEVEVRNNMDVREFLYIDAHTGKLVEQFTGIAHALDRVLYENNTSNQIWQEGNALPGSLDQWQQNELIAAEHTYNFFNNAFGYVSYDGADAQMRTINNAPINCPNASWNGSTANYCTGTAADDVVAHEWGHAYTQFTSGLIYAYQSGALNEAYSDIWGETVDLLNNYEDTGEDLSIRSGCGSSDRWRMGEDASAFGGAIRDMWDPTCNNDPGKGTDPQFWCGSGDSGGVHINSGVPNHAYALLVDGGSFNGVSVSNIGFTKAAHIFWRAQSQYLTPSSNFADFADALEASTSDLIGINLEGLSTTSSAAGPSGQIISAADLQEVTDAINAVELRVNVANVCPPLIRPIRDLCEAYTNNPLYIEDWENGIGGWTVEQLPENAATWTSRDWVLDTTLPDGRVGTGMFGIDPIIGNCSTDLENGIIRLQSPIITIPDITDGTFDLAFNHYIVTEGSWDGGNIKYKLDTGEWTLLPSSAFSANAYNSSLNSTIDGNDNPMQGQVAFTGADGGTGEGTWGTSVIDLSTIGVVANSKLQLRWELGTDGCNGVDGWYLDEIVIYNCSAALSVAENDIIKENIKVFPNPADNMFTIKRLTSISLQNARINDINGRLIKQIDLSQMQNTLDVDISEVASGIYFMEVSSDLGKGTIKLVKE